jgi:low affinity Fe/Cu permease
LNRTFTRLADWVARGAGKPWTVALAFLAILVWAATGPMFNYSDTWQLVVNTATTIVTFLMVFLIQATQNRDTLATQAKLDELIRSSQARNEFMLIDKLTDEDVSSKSQAGDPHLKVGEESLLLVEPAQMFYT